MSDGDSLRSFLYDIGFINDPSGAAKVEAQAQKTEAKLSATAEAGAAKRVAIEEVAGQKTKTVVDRLLDERAAAEAASAERRKAAARAVLLDMLGLEEDAAGKVIAKQKQNAGKAIEIDRDHAKKSREIRATQMKELEAGLLQFSGFAQGIATGLSGALASAPFGALLVGVERTAAGLAKMAVQSQRVGASVAGIERFKFALRQQGVEEGEATGALEGFASKMKENPEGYRQVLERMGVRTLGSDGKVLGNDELLERLGAQLAAVPYNQARIQAGQIGISGDNAINALRAPAETRKGLDAYDAKLKGFGFDPDKAAEDARKVDQAYNNLSADLKIVATKLQAEFFNPMLVGFDSIAKKMEANPQVVENYGRALEALALSVSARVLPVLTNLAVRLTGLSAVLGTGLGTAVGIATNPVVALGASAESTPGAGIPTDAAERAKVAEENRRLTEEANKRQGSSGSIWADSLAYLKGKLGFGDDTKVKADIATTAESVKKLADRADQPGGAGAGGGSVEVLPHGPHHGIGVRAQGGDDRSWWQRHAPSVVGGKDAPTPEERLRKAAKGPGPDMSLPQGPVPGASGAGLKNAYWRGPLDGRGEGGRLGPREMFAYLKSIGATDKEATMLTGAASSESSFNPEANHDPLYPGGPPTGHGLFGHKHTRLDMRGKNWQEQSALALNEFRHMNVKGIGNLADALARAQTPEEVADIEMHYEGPAGYRKNNPRAGDNYMGRLNSIRRFSAMGGEDGQPTAPASLSSSTSISDQAALDARNRLAAGRGTDADRDLERRYREQQNAPTSTPYHPADDDRATRTRASEVPSVYGWHQSPVQFSKGGGANALTELYKAGWGREPLLVVVTKPVPLSEASLKLHEMIAKHEAAGTLHSVLNPTLHPHQLVSSSVLNSVRHGDRSQTIHRAGDTFHVHGTDAKTGLEAATKVSARRESQDSIRYMQGSQQ